jgi:hypothetical protein
MILSKVHSLILEKMILHHLLTEIKIYLLLILKETFIQIMNNFNQNLVIFKKIILMIKIF